MKEKLFEIFSAFLVVVILVLCISSGIGLYGWVSSRWIEGKKISTSQVSNEAKQEAPKTITEEIEESSPVASVPKKVKKRSSKMAKISKRSEVKTVTKTVTRTIYSEKKDNNLVINIDKDGPKQIIININ
jgi:hypothetical protein